MNINQVVQLMQNENISACHALGKVTGKPILVICKQNKTAGEYKEIYHGDRQTPIGVVKKHAVGEFQAITRRGNIATFTTSDLAILALFVNT